MSDRIDPLGLWAAPHVPTAMRIARIAAELVAKPQVTAEDVELLAFEVEELRAAVGEPTREG